MLGVGGVFEDGVDSAVVDALRRGRWSPGDLLSRLYHSLRSAGVPHRCSQQRSCRSFKHSTIQQNANSYILLPHSASAAPVQIW